MPPAPAKARYLTTIEACRGIPLRESPKESPCASIATGFVIWKAAHGRLAAIRKADLFDAGQPQVKFSSFGNSATRQAWMPISAFWITYPAHHAAYPDVAVCAEPFCRSPSSLCSRRRRPRPTRRRPRQTVAALSTSSMSPLDPSRNISEKEQRCRAITNTYPTPENSNLRKRFSFEPAFPLECQSQP